MDLLNKVKQNGCKFIFVTWWVVSWLGKGIVASSIWRLLKSAGYSVTNIKMDPYLQIDAGTMSPYEHWEVFVTQDWWETDLDLGHYERFVDVNLNKNSSITSGKVFDKVIRKERRWDYLGQTVQIIPHVTNEIKILLFESAKDYDISIVEIWGTIWDIEAPHFIETARQLRHDLWSNNVMYVHLAPLLNMNHIGELKTKPIQHSYKELLNMWIKADMIFCRSEVTVSDKIKKKIGMFCDLDNNYVIESIDVKSLYEVPLLFARQNVDLLIQERLNLQAKKSDLTNWAKIVDTHINPSKEINIWIAWKYTKLKDTYLSVIESLEHAGIKHDCKVNIKLLDTEKFEWKQWEENLEKTIQNEKLAGIVIPWWFGDRGTEWKIQVAKYCRENSIPFLWICLWLQIAVMEYARNVCGINDANSAEFDINGKNLVIDIMETQKDITNKWWTMRLGSYPAILKDGSLAHKLYGSTNITERHRHRFEVNPKYIEQLENNGLSICGKSPDWELVEFIEIHDHKYYIATQAHPEFKSRIDKAHPLFDWLVGACL